MTSRLSAVRGWLGRPGGTLSGWVASIRAPIHIKLFAAFLAIVVLLIVLGLTGLRTLGAANNRAVSLGALANKEDAYYTLQVRTNYVLATGSSVFSVPSSQASAFDQAERQIRLATYDFDRLRFVAADEGTVIDEIQADFNRFVEVMVQVVDLVRHGDQGDAATLQQSTALPLETKLERLTSGLVTKEKSDVITTIGANRDEYVSSRSIVIATSGAVIALALVLGYAIAFSLITPVKQMGAHLDRVASGDFSTHVAVANRDELGVLARRLNAMNDELGRLYRQLEEANRNKSTFLANMSHELRTPLNAIIGFSEVLKERLFGELNEKQDEYVDEVLGSGKHLLSLINDILDLSKVEAGHMELEVGPFALPEALTNGVSMVKERASRRGVNLELEIHPGVDVIEADERKVKQVLYNLLSNAVKFTDFGGRVTVVARSIAEGVEVSVRDTGVGIPLESQDRIFEEFQQVSSTARDQEGTGLGLPLARRLVELHGGRIWVESDPGHGSTFVFTLPRRAPSDAQESSKIVPGETNSDTAGEPTSATRVNQASAAPAVTPLLTPEEQSHAR